MISRRNHRRQRHHPELRPDPGQPGQVGRRDRALGAQPEHAGRADRAKRPAREKHSPPGGADRRSGQRGIQRRPGLAAADAGESRGRVRPAQALPHRPGAGAGVPAAGRCDRADGGRAVPEPGRTRPGVVDQPAAAVSDRLHSGIGVAVSGGHQHGSRCRRGTYCKIPMDTPANSVRGSRNIPCVDIPGKRAATPRECRDPAPYVPAGTNPWFGDPNQILTCPAPAARCDQSVRPGMVIPAPSINNGLNPAPLGPGRRGTPPPVSDPLSRPGSRYRAVQRTAAQPVCLHSERASRGGIQSPER